MHLIILYCTPIKNISYLKGSAADLCTQETCSYKISAVENVFTHKSQGHNFLSLSGPVKSTVSTLYKQLNNS